MSYDKDQIFELLEEKMLSYEDYANIIVDEFDSKTKFVELYKNYGLLVVDPIIDEGPRSGSIVIRSALEQMLHLAGQELKQYDPDLKLSIRYGYRSLRKQTELFNTAKRQLQDRYSGDELIRAAHRQIAVPEVGGHPTGGAVDVDVLKDGRPIDMGSPVWDWTSKASFTFNPFLSREAWANRQLLRRAMMAVGFAPFDGEWWHFSYGDKEWARFYNRPAAMFDQVPDDEVADRMDYSMIERAGR